MASTSMPMDMELKKAFTMLQNQQLSTRESMITIQQEMDKAYRTKVISHITLNAMNSLKSDQQTFESVGRCFILREPIVIKEGLSKKISDSEAKIAVLEGTKESMQKKVQQMETNLREMIITKKDQMK